MRDLPTRSRGFSLFAHLCPQPARPVGGDRLRVEVFVEPGQLGLIDRPHREIAKPFVAQLVQKLPIDHLLLPFRPQAVGVRAEEIVFGFRWILILAKARLTEIRGPTDDDAAFRGALDNLELGAADCFYSRWPCVNLH